MDLNKKIKIINACCLITIFLSFLFFVINLIIFTPKIETLKQQISIVQENIEKNEKENESLKKQLEDENYEDYIKNRAYEYGYIDDNGIIFYDIS